MAPNDTSRGFARLLFAGAAAGALVASAFVAVPAVATPPPVVKADTDTLTFTAALNYDRAGLLAAARAISTPGGPSYRNFLTLKQVAAQYGPSQAQRTALRAAATKLGITVTFSATGLTADLTAPVETWSKVYGIKPTVMDPEPPANPWAVVTYVDAQGNYASTPPALKKHVRMVMPEMSVLVPEPVTPSSRKRFLRPTADDTPPTNMGTPFGPGQECIPAPIQPYVYSPSQIHTPYGTTALHKRGLTGQGVRIANLAGGYAFSREFLDFAADCFEFRAAPVRFSGGPAVGSKPVSTSGDDEGNLDVQTIAAVVPDAARVDFVELANTDVLYLAFVQAVDYLVTEVTPLPDVSTMSFGTCEGDLVGPGMDDLRAVSDDHFALAGILGVSMFAASGDGGSSDCSQFVPNPPIEGRLPSVQYPASSPWVTGVGGTRLVLGPGNVRVNEVVWNDTPWAQPMGSTGGASLAARPWYQRPVTAQDRRLVPDIAAHASTFAGWPMAASDEGQIIIEPVAGTSAASPFVAANFALLAAQERKAGRGPLGFVSPMLYELAANATLYKRAFYDITEGDNQLYFDASCCKATRGYDTTTGLGSLTFDELIKVIPKPGRGRG